MTKWAGVNYSKNGPQPADDVDFRRSRDHLTDWTNNVLGKNYMYKHDGRELPIKTANLIPTLDTKKVSVTKK